MFSAINSAQSALQTFGTKLQSNGNNIANVNSDGYKKTRVTAESAEPQQGVKAQVDTVEISGNYAYQETEAGGELTELSNVNMAEEMTDMNLNSRMYQANLKTIQTADEMTENLLDIKA